MLLYLSQIMAESYSGFNVFQYLTLRAILGVLTALVISLVVGPMMIRRLDPPRQMRLLTLLLSLIRSRPN